MPIRWASAARHAHLTGSYGLDDRVYLSRGLEYPPVYSSATFTSFGFLDDLTDCQLALGFDEGTGSTTRDASANANVATLNGAVTWVDGRRGKALLSDGAAGSYAITNSNVPALLTTWTIAADIVPASLQASARIAVGATIQTLFYVGKSSTHKALGSWRDSAAVQHTLTGTTTFVVGTHYYVELIHSGTTTYLLVNGVVEAVDAVNDSQSISAQTWQVGRIGGGGNEFNATIDDVRLYDVALSFAQARMVAMMHFPGSHVMTGGYAQYLLDMQTKFILHIEAKAAFAYDIGVNQVLASWYQDANNNCYVFYAQVQDAIRVIWTQGGVQSILSTSVAYTQATLDAITTITLVLDSTTGTTAGSALYVNGVLEDAVWSAAIPARGVRIPAFNLRALGVIGAGLTPSAWDISAARLFPNRVATAAEVANNFESVKNEEIYWALDGHALGLSRFSISAERHQVQAVTLERFVEDPEVGHLVANRATIELIGEQGEFCDDQYAAFDPTLRQYNGTIAEKYLRRHPRVIVENWYGSEWDPIFVGRVEGGFPRSTSSQDFQRATIVCADAARTCGLRKLRKGRIWEDKKLADAVEADSLAHLIVREAVQTEVVNYLGNSGFENATIGNSWNATGGTLTRQADPLIGSFCGQLANASGAPQTVTETVTYLGNKKLNVGEQWTVVVWLKSAGAAAANVDIVEADAGGANGTSSVAYSLAGGEGWVRFAITRQVTDAASDRLRAVFNVPNGVTLKFDCSGLYQMRRAPDWWVLNATDGAAGVISADSAASALYDTCGFRVDPVNVVHPWLRIERGETVWPYVLDLAVSVLAYEAGFDEAGCFVLRGALATSFRDPIPEMILDGGERLESVPIEEETNRIIVRGDRIEKQTRPVMIWNAGGAFPDAGSKIGGDGIGVTFPNGGYFPNPATYGRFIAEYGVTGAIGAGDTAKGGAIYTFFYLGMPNPGSGGRTLKYIPAPDCQAVGVKDVNLNIATNKGPGIGVTQVTLDAATWANGVEILLRNDYGADMVIYDVALFGKMALRFSGNAGWIHDEFSDWERIAEEGEKPLEISCRLICTLVQINAIAEHYWKSSRIDKHRRVRSDVGCWYKVSPGTYYHLREGQAGDREYIDEIARAVIVRTERRTNMEPRTTIETAEVLQDWVQDSTASARYVATRGYHVQR